MKPKNFDAKIHFYDKIRFSSQKRFESKKKKNLRVEQNKFYESKIRGKRRFLSREKKCDF